MDEHNQQAGQSPYGESAAGGVGTAARLKEQISEKAAGLKESVVEFGRKTADKLDGSRESAAGALEHTATSLHKGGDRCSSMAHTAADKIQATADYVRRTDLKGMGADVQGLVERYPAQSLAAAAILGFLLARRLRSSV